MNVSKYFNNNKRSINKIIFFSFQTSESATQYFNFNLYHYEIYFNDLIKNISEKKNEHQKFTNIKIKYIE